MGKEIYLYLQPIHPYAYRRDDGELPLVLSVVMYEPDGNLDKRVCYKVKYLNDGFTDYVPISEVENGNYKLVESPNNLSDVLKWG